MEVEGSLSSSTGGSNDAQKQHKCITQPDTHIHTHVAPCLCDVQCQGGVRVGGGKFIHLGILFAQHVFLTSLLLLLLLRLSTVVLHTSVRGNVEKGCRKIKDSERERLACIRPKQPHLICSRDLYVAAPLSA